MDLAVELVNCLVTSLLAN